MPDVHFVGELESAALTDCPQISVTFAIVPGNGGWLLKAGHSHGETQTSVISLQDWSYLNHPLDAHYESSSAEGWPFLVCEVWDKSNEGVRSFVGCGGVWLPQSGTHSIEVSLWKPRSSGLDAITGMFLPTCPDLRALRELIVSPYLRSQVQVDTVGVIRVKVNVVTAGFDQHGVQF